MSFSSTKLKIAASVKRIRELQGSPSYLARGVALGVFIGVAPLMPLKSILILLLSLMLSSSAVAAFLVCTIICNPLTYIPLYYLSWLTGNLLLPGKSSWTMLETSVSQMGQLSLSGALILAGQVGFETIIVLLVGGCVIALPLALVSYPFAHRMFKTFSKRK
ncbi:MAG: DUF2062 domain-containing protein [Deltaproteobacteria bacterium]|nr:DUF2062 domain-containing protein [Deltaproteobacteria bacterium]